MRRAIRALAAGLALCAAALGSLAFLVVAVPIALAAGILFLWLMVASPIFMLAGALGLMPSGLSRDLAMFPAQALVIGGMIGGVLWFAGLCLRALAEAIGDAWRYLRKRRRPEGS
ncbi:hypothetical protein [Methylorubrum sp. POS3]|uniref:hypothetical protein n=1 Tax=Methylorubrum sp. POS3 TaxID=2998492 RepID=UPI0037286559